MSNDSGRSAKDFIRGGQIFQNNLTMLREVLRTIGIVSLVIGAVVFACVYFMKTTDYQRYLFGEAIHTSMFFKPNIHDYMKFQYPDGRMVTVRVLDVMYNKSVSDNFDYVMTVIKSGINIGFFSGFGIAILGMLYLRIKGKSIMKDKVVSGIEFEPDKNKVIAFIEKYNAAKKYKTRYHLAGIPFLKDTETFSVSISGAQGQGKTVTLSELLDEINANGDRAIIYDKQRSYIKTYYREGRDILLNPLDKRSVPWNIHADASTLYEYESIAKAMIPQKEDSSSDPYWVLGARTILSTVALRFRHEKRFKTRDLLKSLYCLSLDEIAGLLKGTPAGALIDVKNPKTSESIRSVMSAYIKSMNYVFDDVDPQQLFSIKKWVHDDKANSHIFLTSSGDIHDAIKPLYTAIFEIIIKACMTLNQSSNRRIFIILDELPSLNYVPTLIDGMAELRQFGVVFILGYQLHSQIKSIYKDNAQTISGLSGSRVAFQTPDEQTATWVSKNFTEVEIQRYKEGLSFGGNTIRDGVNISSTETKKAVVSASDIMSLPPLSCYIKMAGGTPPVTKVELKTKDRKEISEPFVPRNLDELAFGDLVFDDDVDMTEAPEMSVSSVFVEQVKSEIVNVGRTQNEAKRQTSIIDIPPPPPPVSSSYVTPVSIQTPLPMSETDDSDELVLPDVPKDIYMNAPDIIEKVMDSDVEVKQLTPPQGSQTSARSEAKSLSESAAGKDSTEDNYELDV